MAKLFQLHCLLLLASIAFELSLARSVDLVWHSWKQKHGKQYTDSNEEQKRRDIWQQHVDAIHAHNLRFDVGLETYRQGVNQFHDLTFDEFAEKHLSKADHIPSDIDNMADVGQRHQVNEDDLPPTVDWREKGYVTSVKEEEICQDSWAFAATGTLEGQLANKTGKQAVSLSVQQLLDCDKGDYGCMGGWPGSALVYAQEWGMMSNDDYPYTSNPAECKWNKSRILFQNSGILFVPHAGEPRLTEMVARNGPISVNVVAPMSFMSYASGIYTESVQQCKAQQQWKHNMLIVGYGFDDCIPYWLVKNTWGTSWGIKGYIQWARNYNNMCNIANYPYAAII